MQIALQDIRVLGYEKIASKYLSNRDEFLHRVETISAKLYANKIPAYSFLSKWFMFSDVDKAYKSGYSLLVYSLEPMIDLEKPSNASKRKFRNTWASIWSSFCQVAGIDQNTCDMLSDLGLKLLFTQIPSQDNKLSCEQDKVQMWVESTNYLLKFYNAVLTWFIFLQQESNFDKNNMTLFDVLSLLVVNDENDFEEVLKSVH